MCIIGLEIRGWQHCHGLNAKQPAEPRVSVCTRLSFSASYKTLNGMVKRNELGNMFKLTLQYVYVSDHLPFHHSVPLFTL